MTPARTVVAPLSPDEHSSSVVNELVARKSGAPSARLREWRLYSIDQLAKVPPVQFAIEPVWLKHGISILAGPSGSGKSLIALDWALTRATGRNFNRKPVDAGGVVYVTAEGRDGMAVRAAAWCALHGIEQQGDLPFRLIPAAPQILDPSHLDRLMRLIESAPFEVNNVVIDTFARTFVGKNENAAEDVVQYVDAIYKLAAKIDGHVGVIHHSGWDRSRERGHTALRAGVDAVMLTSKKNSFVEVSCLKQKDAEEFATLRYELRIHGASVVALLTFPDERGRQAKPLGKKHLEALAGLRNASDGLTYSHWKAVVPDLSPSTFKRIRNVLLKLGFIELRGAKYYATEGVGVI